MCHFYIAIKIAFLKANLLDTVLTLETPFSFKAFVLQITFALQYFY